MSLKRGVELAGAPAKRPATETSLYAIGLVSNQEELDGKVLLLQNKNLATKVEWLNGEVKDLRLKNANLEKTREMHDMTVSTIGRFWDRLDRDVLNLLAQFEDTPPTSKQTYSEGVTMFLERLGADDTGEGLDKGLEKKFHFTNSVVSKLVELIEQSRQIWRANAELFGSGDCDLEEIVKEENGQMRQEVERLQSHFLELTEKERTASTKLVGLEDVVILRDSKINQLEDQVARLTYENEKAREQVERHKRRLSDLIKQQQQIALNISTSNTGATADKSDADGGTGSGGGDVSEVQSLADARLVELQSLQGRLEETVRQLEVAKLESGRSRSENDIQQGNNMASLQAQFTRLAMSVYANDRPGTRSTRFMLKYWREEETVQEEPTSTSKSLRRTTTTRYFIFTHPRCGFLGASCLFLAVILGLLSVLLVPSPASEVTVSSPGLFGYMEEQQRKASMSTLQDLLDLLNLLDERTTDLGAESAGLKQQLVAIATLDRDQTASIERLSSLTSSHSSLIQGNNMASLQAQFTLLYNEHSATKQQLEETKHLLAQRCQQHMIQLEQVEVEEDAAMKKMKHELLTKEEALAAMKKDYDVLHFKFQRYLAANEQTGPSNKEMRNMISSLQAHNTLLKNEVIRGKKRTSELAVQIANCRDQKTLEGSEALELVKELAVSEDKEKEEQHKKKIDELSATIKDLQKQLKTSHENQKELKLLLDVFKGSVKESRSKVELLASEKRLQDELGEALSTLKKKERDLEVAQRRAAGITDDDISAQLADVQKLNAGIQEELKEKTASSDALVNDLELLGTAFEDLQEQNMRLLQQLKEKDDANFKLMSERIKADELLKLLREEKELLGDHTQALKNQRDSQQALLRKVEERERQLQGGINTLEKELTLKQQAIDLHKKEATKHSLNYTELKNSFDSLSAEVEGIRSKIADKTALLEAEQFKSRRKEEEVVAYKRKLDRHNKDNPLSTTIDEVLEEEVRMYKQKLTCPVCNVRKKDAVLTKCFHIFCFECMKLRYDTRQRKCPKCNAAFGASDFHRIYM